MGKKRNKKKDKTKAVGTPVKEEASKEAGFGKRSWKRDVAFFVAGVIVTVV